MTVNFKIANYNEEIYINTKDIYLRILGDKYYICLLMDNKVYWKVDKETFEIVKDAYLQN